jgi:translocation and assembly module TamA
VRAAVAYETEIHVPGDDKLADELKASSQLVARQAAGADSESALRRRAGADIKRLQDVTHAAGYYDAKLDYKIDQHHKPWRVIVDVRLGEPYRLREVRLIGPKGGAPPLSENFNPANFGLQLGARAVSNMVVNGEAKILRYYTEKGRPLAKMLGREVVIDRADHSMHVTYRIDAGPQAMFGAAKISGLKSVDRRFVKRRLQWHEGELYNSDKVAATQQLLVDSNLFSVVKIAPANSVGPDGRIAMNIQLTERPPRSIGAGVYYDTSTGFAARAFWEHRNLFGQGEQLHLEGVVGQSEYGALAQFRRPYFLMRDLDFRAEAAISKLTLPAYDARQASIFAGLDRRFSKTWSGGAGVEFIQADVQDATGVFTQNYGLVGVPFYVRRDTSDDLLNPTKGSRLGLTMTPFTSVDGKSISFLSAKVSASAYQRLGRSDRFVLAGYANVGSTTGVSLADLPRNQRLYAGGGGSVRAYGYQMAGPLDAFGNPIGGLSSLELGIELRTKITETIGLATFVDAGSVYDQSLPNLSQKLFWGPGIGLRYYSPIGPVRFDVATPFVRRSSDGLVQVYISLGQAF